MADRSGTVEDADGSGGIGEAGGSEETTYSGLLTAIPYAFRASRSRLFRGYVVIGTLAAVAVTVLMTLALVVVFGATATGTGGGSLTLSRAFYVVVGLFVVGPILAPLLLVARRHRREGSTKRYDGALGLAGFAFLGSLYLGLLISVPPAQQTPPQPVAIVLGGNTIGSVQLPIVRTTIDILVPIVEFFYGLPQLAGLVPPVLAAGLIALAHRLTK
ncbi:hypothetical protein [Halococcus agarilyticus]|uniref:hypothetical protein n=1 Tax=Halococcus agarilyticus TaxID=1232219 RepID=UPI0006778C02|nr:hypothetical protein [Halococcus agarilyticus]